MKKTHKKRTVLIALPLLLIAAAWATGITPRYIANAPEVATGIGARLACSMHFVMGQDKDQLAQDIKVYSPILSYLNYELDEQNKTASAEILGIKRTASWQPNMGCALNYAGVERQPIDWPQPSRMRAAAPWPQGYEVNTLNPDVQDQLNAMLKKDNQQGLDTRALLVAHQGKIVAESYAPGYDEQSLFLGWSMAKSVTSLLTGWMVQQDKINLLEMGLFPAWLEDERRTISVMNLLQMTDGLAYDEIYQPGETAPAMLFQAPDAAQYMIDRPLRDTPGEHYNYSSGSTNLVMRLIQQRLSRDPSEAVQIMANEFFKPLGINSLVFESDNQGLLMGSSYMYANARDWAKIGQLMLNEGHLNNFYVVTPEWVRESIQPNASANQQNFGYNWWINQPQKRWQSLAPTAYAAKGNREQRIMILPDHELVIVRLGWTEETYPDDANAAEIVRWFENKKQQ